MHIPTAQAAPATAFAVLPPQLQTAGVHHIVLRCSELVRSRHFYADVLGFPIVLDSEALVVVMAGATAIGLRGPPAEAPLAEGFARYRVGLDHIALRCTQEAELQRVGAALAAAGVEHTAPPAGGGARRRGLAFRDPDGIGWEISLA